MDKIKESKKPRKLKRCSEEIKKVKWVDIETINEKTYLSVFLEHSNNFYVFKIGQISEKILGCSIVELLSKFINKRICF